MYVVDIETKDPNLKDLGDGSIRKDGRILMVGVHGEGEEGKVSDVFLPTDPKLAAILATNDTKVFHNGVYDLAWLDVGYGFKVNGKIDDTMTREVLLNEYQPSYSLDESCARRGVEGKNYHDTIDRWWKDNGGKGKAIENLENMPEQIVAKYCHNDCRATYDLWHKQQPLIDQWDLQHVVDTESALFPILMEMKRNGIRVDSERRDAFAYELMEQIADLRLALEEEWGIENINSPVQIRKFFNNLGIHSPETTDTGNESFGSDVLMDIDHPAAQILAKAKVFDKAYGTFLKGYFTDCEVSGRIHPTFYPSLRDEGGTITGRFSSRNPNMQNIPADDRTLGPQIRAMILPDEDCILGAFDYKQIEYTVFIHYAIGPGAEKARQSIIAGVDYHTMAQQMLKWDTPERQAALGWSKHDARKMVKNFNFGSIYGLGRNGFKKKFGRGLLIGANALGKPLDVYADKLYDEYFTMLPFVRPTCKGIQDLAKSKGYMRSVGKRIHHRPVRRGDYAMVNYICQGGASDILKLGFVKAWKAGVFDYIKLHITVHDENVFSVYPNKTSIEAATEYSKIMTEAVQLKVPVRVDEEAGFNWAECDTDQWKAWREKHG